MPWLLYSIWSLYLFVVSWSLSVDTDDMTAEDSNGSKNNSEDSPSASASDSPQPHTTTTTTASQQEQENNDQGIIMSLTYSDFVYPQTETDPLEYNINVQPPHNGITGNLPYYLPAEFQVIQESSVPLLQVPFVIFRILKLYLFMFQSYICDLKIWD